MKKLILLVTMFSFFSLFLSTKVSAYNPSSGDLNDLLVLRNTLDEICSGNNLDTWDFYYQIKNLKEQFSGDDKLNYMLGELGGYMIGKLTIEKTKVKTESKTLKQDFLDKYLTGISLDISTINYCTGRYNTIDNISFANNFPTALTIATRYRETTCGYYLPSNGDGPFQILSKDYGTGEITENIFVQSVQDFIDFSKSKYGAHYSKIGPIFTYTGFDMTGLVNHAALYNGGTLTGSIESGYIVRPNAPKYVWDGYGEFTGAIRYGVFPKFLKILDWELNNVY